MGGSEGGLLSWAQRGAGALPTRLVLSGVYVQILQFALDRVVTVC